MIYGRIGNYKQRKITIKNMSNYLITKQGRKIDCQYGQDHEITCYRYFKQSLTGFLKELRGVRVKLHGIECSVECWSIPNTQQVGKINGILRKNEVYRLVTSFRGNYNIRSTFNRPIRKIK